MGFTALLTSQIISVAFYTEREKPNKFCTEALISAWGSFTCRKSTTRDPLLYFPSEESHTQDFYALKKSMDPGRDRTREPRIKRRVWLPLDHRGRQSISEYIHCTFSHTTNAISFYSCYFDTLQHSDHIAFRIFGYIPESCVFLLLCNRCFFVKLLLIYDLWIWWIMVKWIAVPVMKIQSSIYLGDRGKQWKTLVRLVGTGILTRNLSNTSPVCYRYATSLNKNAFVFGFLSIT